MIPLPLADLARLGLIQGINAVYSRQTQTHETDGTTITLSHLIQAFDRLRAIGTGELANLLTGPSSREIAANGLTPEPQGKSSAEMHVLENYLELGCLIYAIPREMDLEEAARNLGVSLRKALPETVVGACATGHPFLDDLWRFHSAYSFLLRTVGLAAVSIYLQSKGVSEEDWESHTGFEALGARTSREDRLLEDLDGIIRRPRRREISTVSKSIYRELTDGGFDTKEIIACAADLLGLATEDISKGKK